MSSRTERNRTAAREAGGGAAKAHLTTNDLALASFSSCERSAEGSMLMPARQERGEEGVRTTMQLLSPR